jgi:hypothetical protein
MTEDTSQPPAPQPGWVATVTLTAAIVEQNTITAAGPNGELIYVGRLVGDLDWSPPPPPPWEPKIDGRAHWLDEDVTIRAIRYQKAWVEMDGGSLDTAALSSLSPPKGGA